MKHKINILIQRKDTETQREKAICEDTYKDMWDRKPCGKDGRDCRMLPHATECKKPSETGTVHASGLQR